MRYCSLLARDLRLLDPMFINPSTILGQERAIAIGLEQVKEQELEIYPVLDELASSISTSNLELNLVFNIEKLEMLLEAYFVSIDNTLNNILSLKECIDDTKDFIDIKLENFQNWLMQFELLLAVATFGATMFAIVTGVFGMNLAPENFDNSSSFNWALIITGVADLNLKLELETDGFVTTLELLLVIEKLEYHLVNALELKK
ncbi:hypothetical protein GIB67_015185 [Kingdonia uniflora]|uniref:Magnesium transporter n=1 Tax=Kingdonia uniflora TaxID=39325 RepID=A0A7J7LJF6_9MAGN|nr:hypothetical protein GIB67_015185 [Kingdonia uniflora]